MRVNERKLMVLLYVASFLLLWKLYWALIGLVCSGRQSHGRMCCF